MAPDDADNRLIQSIERAAQVLALFDQDTQSLSSVTVAERLGLNRTTAHRYLVSLQAAGFLNRMNGPGPLLDQLGAYISARRKVLGLAPVLMRGLSDATGLTVVMSIPGRSGAVVALVEESTAGTTVVTVRVGTILPPKSAQSRVLMSFQEDQSVISRYLSQGVAGDATRELEQLARIRREGIGWSDLGHLGLATVAAPIFCDGNVQAALALIGTSKMLPKLEEPTQMVEMLRRTAAVLGEQLTTG